MKILIEEAQARHRADRIPGALGLPWIGDQDEPLDRVEGFLTGVRPIPQPDRVLTTLLFTDIVRSTERAASLGDERWRHLLQRHCGVVRAELARFQGREIDNAGDEFLASFEAPGRAVRCANSIVAEVRRLGIEVRAGVHTGECEVLGNKLAGVAVHIGARVVRLAGPSEVLVSRTVRDLVSGSGLEFEDRGLHQLKGIDGQWRLFAVVRLPCPDSHQILGGGD